VITYVGYEESTTYKDALARKLLISRSSFELSHRLLARGWTATALSPAVAGRVRGYSLPRCPPPLHRPVMLKEWPPVEW
jgi:hypothetical protein